MRNLVNVALVLGLLSGTAAAHDGPHTGSGDATFRIGKDGRVKIGDDMLVGDMVVKKGTYAFDHRVDDTRHLVTLTRVDGKVPEQAPVEVRMRLIPSKQIVKRTAILAHEEEKTRFVRLSLVQVAGESGDHVIDVTNSGE